MSERDPSDIAREDRIQRDLEEPSTVGAFKHPTSALLAVLNSFQPQALRDILAERVRQFEKWGEQDHDACTFQTILSEEVGEFAEECLNFKFHGSPINGNLRTEAVQVAAVALQIIEWIDSKTPTPPAQ